jgi:hypothetical protein
MGDPTTAARELAMWWAAWHTWTGTNLRGMPPARRLDDAERERLFTWVRGRMDEYDPSLPTCTREDLAAMVGELLGLDGLDAFALCEAAGWPS